jgi:hypothetical protein
MIKVQPSHSRIVKSETPDRVSLTMPARGYLGFSGVVILGSLGWMAFTVYLFIEALRRHSPEFAVVSAVITLPGVLALLAGVADGMRTWSVERDVQWLTVERRGLLGERRDRWPAGDIASIYPQSAVTGGPDRPEAWLAVGFRNGRSVTTVKEEWEEIQWASAMLDDERGVRRVTSPLQLAAEPERRRVDPEMVPTTLTCRIFEGGAEVTFHPLLRSKGNWWKLPLLALLAVFAVVGISVALYKGTHGGFSPVFPRLTIAAILVASGWRMWVLQRSAVVQMMDGIVTIVQNQGREPQQFGMNEVEFVQTFRVGRHTELQFLLRNSKPKVRLLEGRPATELEWAARFLRVAIKGRPAVPETATMKVDAAVGECQVCLEKMESRVVYCAKCRTPAHEECWSYIGMCSTYGCREIRFERI